MSAKVGRVPSAIGVEPEAFSQGEMSDVPGQDPANWHNVSGERLRSLIDRIERLEEEKKSLSGDIKDIFAQAKSAGFDVKVMRQLIRIRKMTPAEVEEQETLLDVYRRALGM